MNIFLIALGTLAFMTSQSNSSDIPNINKELKLIELKSGEFKNKNFNISSIGNIIDQLLNKTKPTKPTTTTISPTNITTVTPKPPPPCVCGKGGKPKVNFRQLDDLDYDLEDNLSAERSLDIEDKLKEEGDATRIIHGVASNPHAYPWIAGIINGFNSNGTGPLNVICGGSLINNQWILTAAHCFNEFSNNSQILANISVVLGTNSIASNVTARVVSRIIAAQIHPKYNRITSDNDITLLKLAVPLTFSTTISPICLHQAGSPFAHRKVVLAGWGSTNALGLVYPTYLREAGLTTITNANCAQRFDTTSGITGNMICAVGTSPSTNTNACFGDSGGPLIMYQKKTKTFTQIGLTSFGPAVCGANFAPTVYTRVGKYINFIKSVTNGTAFCSNSF